MLAAWLFASLAIFAAGLNNLTVHEVVDSQIVKGHLRTIQGKITNGASGTVKTSLGGRMSSEEFQTKMASGCLLKVDVKLTKVGNHMMVSGLTVCKSDFAEKRHVQEADLEITKLCSATVYTEKDGKFDMILPSILQEIRHMKHKLSAKRCAIIQFNYGT